MTDIRARIERTSELITAEWLASVDFKWHQLERQPDKHWLLWLGGALSRGDTEQLGIELAPVGPSFEDKAGAWFCWLRSDFAHRYHRFIFVRYLRTQEELAQLVAALTGQPWDPGNHLWGAVRRPEAAERMRREDRERLDRKMLREGRPWSEAETDETRGGALPEHLEALIKGQKP